MMMRKGLYLPIFAHLEFWYLLCINSLQSDLDTVASMKQNLKYAIQIAFYIVFCIFSFSSLKHFYNGSVVYETKHNFDNEDVPFPSITLCPALKTNNLVNLKINELVKDFNLQDDATQSFFIYPTLKRIGINNSFMEIVRNYSFTYTEGFYINHVVRNQYGQELKTRNDSNSLV